MNLMYVVVLDFETAVTHILPFDSMLEHEEIEKVLFEDYGFKKNNVQWMVSDKIKIGFG